MLVLPYDLKLTLFCFIIDLNVTNIAKGKNATQISTYGAIHSARYAVDGIIGCYSHTYVARCLYNFFLYFVSAVSKWLFSVLNSEIQV